MTSVLNANLPDIDPDERAALIGVANGSPGNAVRFAGLDVAWMDQMLDQLARDGDASNALRVALAAKLSPKSAQGRYEAFLDRVPSFIAQRARQLQGDSLGQALQTWEKARELAAGAVQGSLDTVSVVHALSGHVAALAPPRNNAKA
jgi:DNA polymerase-3 subunit delta'